MAIDKERPSWRVRVFVLVTFVVVCGDFSRLLGADFTRPGEMLRDEYPFIRELRRHLSKDPRVEVLNPIAMLRQGEEQGDDII